MFNDSRKKTDDSLDHERKKTDSYLSQESKTVEDESDESVQFYREAADKKLEEQRMKIDNEKVGPHRTTPLLDEERERSDKAQQYAREKEDDVRALERHQKRLITEAFLDTERKDTDSNLQDERTGMDLISSNAESALVTRDQYLAIVSHDLKNPLNAISLSAATMRRSIQSGNINQSSLVKSLEIVERNVATMDRMISDLLDVERMASDGLMIIKKRCSLNNLLEECLEIFAPAILNKEFKMVIDKSNEQLYANIDHDRILQVLSNLIGNALKFTPKGGRIELSMKSKSGDIELSVADNGPGIPKNKQTEIFERFSQLKINDRRGLGLGLFISKWIVEAHGGQVSVYSEEQGSKFSFTIPSALT